MNEPRFYVVELSGFDTLTSGRETIVAHYAEPTSGGIPGRQDYPTKARRQAWPRDTAAAEAARLNAWDAAA